MAKLVAFQEGKAPLFGFLEGTVWIWVLEGGRKELSSATVNLIEEAVGNAGLAVAAISEWEVAMLEAGEGSRSRNPSTNGWRAHSRHLASGWST